MQFPRSLAFTAILMLLAGCATPAMPPAQSAQTATLKAAASQPLSCSDANDCTTKWQRATLWITHNSSYNIVTQTPDLIKTSGPLEPTTDSAFTVRKSATGAIDFSSSCGKTPVCVPSTTELRASFIRFVMEGY